MQYRRQSLINPRIGFILLFILPVLILGLSQPVSVRAATIFVNSTADDTISGDGWCTLREAISNANSDSDGTGGDCAAGSSDDTIDFDPGLDGSTVILTAGELTLGSNMTISGLPGNDGLAVSGNHSSRVFFIQRGATVEISHLMIKDGSTPLYGGAIYNGGTLTINDSVVRDSTTTSKSAQSGEGGGGIFQAGTLFLYRSTLVNNHSEHHGGGIVEVDATATTIVASTFTGNSTAFGGGGGIHRFSGSSVLNVIDSTIAGNTALRRGAGIALGDNSQGTLNLSHSTIADNTSTQKGNGGLACESGTCNIQNSIISGNRGKIGDGNCSSGRNGGVIVSLGYNLEEGTSCGFIGTGDQQNVDPLLGPLSQNGGPTLTYPLLIGSPAVDVIPSGSNGCGTTFTVDQREAVRAGDCDAGAFEVVSSMVVDGVGFYNVNYALARVTSPGSLTQLDVSYVPIDHPHATDGIKTGRYWDIVPTGGGFTIDLTLPHHSTPDSDDKLCRFSDVGQAWDCGMSGFEITYNTITRNGITQLSAWATGDDVTPTSLRLLALGSRASETVTQNGLLWVGLMLLGTAVVCLRTRRR